MKMLLSLCGYPGFGKTTQCERLKEFYAEKAVVLCVPKLLKFDEECISVLFQNEIQDIHKNINNANEQMQNGVLVDSFIDRLLYSAADRFLDIKELVILDGSPRDIESLKLFISLSNKHLKTRFIMIHLMTQKNEIALSIERQRARRIKDQIHALTELDEHQFKNKALTFNELAKCNIGKMIQQYCDHIEYYEICCEIEKYNLYEKILEILNLV